VTSPTNANERATNLVARSRDDEPFRNPSYPVRDHFAERTKLEEALRIAEERLQAAQRRLEAGGDPARNSDGLRLYHQMLGVRDQIAECARRIPLETGALYEEDHERFKQAMDALERVWQRWEQLRN
jgi:hypothetical protein